MAADASSQFRVTVTETSTFAPQKPSGLHAAGVSWDFEKDERLDGAKPAFGKTTRTITVGPCPAGFHYEEEHHVVNSDEGKSGFSFNRGDHTLVYELWADCGILSSSTIVFHYSWRLVKDATAMHALDKLCGTCSHPLSDHEEVGTGKCTHSGCTCTKGKD